MSEFRPPTIVVNFKVYAEAEGPRALTLAKTCQKVSKESGVQIAVCPPMIGLALIARSMDIPVYSQNVDPLKPGSGTGFVTPSMLHSTDVKGTLVNHSEHRQPLESVGTCIEMCKYLSLDVCACAESAEEAGKIAGFAPQMIAVEPPELIGGDVSVTTANPHIVSDTVDAVHSVNPDVAVLCGAGVKTGEDVRAALDLGARGVLLASGVVKSRDPEAALRDLIKLI